MDNEDAFGVFWIVSMVIAILLTTILVSGSKNGQWQRQAVAEGHGIYVVDGDRAKFEWIDHDERNARDERDAK